MKSIMEVMISTIGAAGLKRVVDMHLPKVEGVSYLVSWQNPEGEIPRELSREDLRVVECDRTGLCANRNNALEHSEADLLLVSDDDLQYTADNLQCVMTVMDAHPELDFASFRYSGPDNKPYPTTEVELDHIPRNFWLVSFELVIRRRVVEQGVRFDERFGIGAPLGAGEEDVLLRSMISHGFRGRFFPIIITHHEGVTTGFRRVAIPATVRGFGAAIAIGYPRTAILRIPLKAWRLARAGQMSFFRALKFLWQGAAMVK